MCEKQFLSEILEKARVIALVGAGGKTSLMYALANYACQQGRKVLVTTSTHIMCPHDESYCETFKACELNWARGRYAVWGMPAGNGKLRALAPQDFRIALACSTIDTILVEADGAKRLSCKAPANHEPQIPDEAGLVLGVAGLSVLGRTIQESCFRPELVAEVLGVNTEHRLTPRDLAVLLASDGGTHKSVGTRPYIAVLNQCDVLDSKQLEQVQEALRFLAEKNIPAVLTALSPVQCVQQSEA